MTECPMCGWTNGLHDPLYMCGRQVEEPKALAYVPGYQETSREAWQDLQEHIGDAQLLTLRQLALAAATGGELNHALGLDVGNPSYHCRARELCGLGLAYRSGKRPCRTSTSNRNVIEYAITDAGRAYLRSRAS